MIVAACHPERQVERLMARDGLDAEAARQRLAAQLPIEEKVRRAAYVVKTDGSYADTDAQIVAVHAALLAR